MPKGKTKRAGPTYTRAVENIRRAMYECSGKRGTSVDQKEVAFSIGMTEAVFSTKLSGIRSHFFEDELEAIAQFFRQKSSRPLTGFPHVSWDMMEAIDRKVCGWKP